ncbi:MAG: RidA family protein [Bacteroidia bacterium]
MDIRTKVAAMGLSWPELSVPGGAYASVNIRGKQGFVAIQFPILNGQFMHQGKIGLDLETADACSAMRLCALNVLAQLAHKPGFEQLLGLNHFDAWYRATDEWDDMPKVADAASELFVELLGEKGRHSRAIMGVAHLPREFAVGLCVTFSLK